MTLNVLVVDGATEVREQTVAALARESFTIRTRSTAGEAIGLADAWRPDVAIIAARLDDGCGLDVVRTLRMGNEAVYVLLTGTHDESSRVHALTLGVDRYITTPCAPRELAAVVVAIARRHQRTVSHIVDLGRVVIDPVRREVLVDGEAIVLTSRELDLLLFLAAHPRQTFTCEQLVLAVWPAGEGRDATTVTELVRRLRLRIELEPLDPRVLVTIRGVGYRFEPAFADRVAS